MKKYQLLTVLLSLILLACISVVIGQYTQYPTSVGYAKQPNPISVGYPTTQTATQVGQTTDVSQYSQYYTTGSPPTTHITAPQPFDISSSTPANVYFSYQQQPVPYSQYQSSPTYAGVNSLWIKGSTSWTQYAAVPQQASVPLLALSPQGGEGYVSETGPDGKTNSYNFYFYPVSLLGFYADTPGRYVLSFSLVGQPSNQIIIDVVAVYKAPTYYSPPSYYSGYPYYYSYINPSFYPSYVPYRYYGYPYYYGYYDYPYYYGYAFDSDDIWAQELAWRMEAYRFLNSP